MSSGQGEIPDRQYSLRPGERLIRWNSVTDGYCKGMRGAIRRMVPRNSPDGRRYDKGSF